MGQYYIAVNIDKQQFIYPHRFNNGAKLMEFGLSACGMMSGLAILLADGNNRGGGDLYSEDPVIGSWAGDRIVITGDYADDGKFTEDPDKNLYDVASESFEDISDKVIVALCDDDYAKALFTESFSGHVIGDRPLPTRENLSRLKAEREASYVLYKLHWRGYRPTHSEMQARVAELYNDTGDFAGDRARLLEAAQDLIKVEGRTRGVLL